MPISPSLFTWQSGLASYSIYVDVESSGACPFGHSTCLRQKTSSSSSLVPGTGHLSRPFAFSRRLHRCLAFGLSNLTPMLSRQLGPFVVDRRATARATEMLSHSTQPNRKFERALQKLTQTASLIKIGYKEN